MMKDSLDDLYVLILYQFFARAGPIARALDKGADVVITGRCVDSALALAPLLHSVSQRLITSGGTIIQILEYRILRKND